ncbi:MAG: hypothetical protein O2877_00225 [bacterium]|nr:hypothetical protein [bacterium]
MRGDRHYDRGGGGGGGSPIDVKKKTAKDFADALHPERSAGRVANPNGFDPEKTYEKKKKRIDISDILPKPGEVRPDFVGDEIQAGFEKLMKEDQAEAEADADFEQSAVRLVTDEELAVDAIDQQAAEAEARAVIQADIKAIVAADAAKSELNFHDKVTTTGAYDVKNARIRPIVTESPLSKLQRGFRDLFARRSAPVEQVTQQKPVAREIPKATEFTQDITSTTGVISARSEAPQEKQGFFSRLFGRRPEAGVSREMQSRYQRNIAATRQGDIGRWAGKRIEANQRLQAPGYQERNIQGYREGKPLPKGDYRYTAEGTSAEQDAAAAYLEKLAHGDSGVSGEEKEAPRKAG